MGALLAALLRRRVVEKGVRNGSSLWLVIGAVGVLRRLYKRMGPRTEQVRLAERLRPGDELTLRYPGVPGRKVQKEQRLVQSRRSAAQSEHEQERARLSERSAGKGRRARRARRLLAALREPRV